MAPIAYFSSCPVTGLPFDEQRQQYRLPASSGHWIQLLEVRKRNAAASDPPRQSLNWRLRRTAHGTVRRGAQVLRESRYTFVVPLKFLEFLVDDQKNWLRDLQR